MSANLQVDATAEQDYISRRTALHFQTRYIHSRWHNYLSFHNSREPGEHALTLDCFPFDFLSLCLTQNVKVTGKVVKSALCFTKYHDIKPYPLRN
jgi:hypothetical protein